MYAWIWRYLPFGLPGKLTGSLLLIGGAVGLLWFVIFPWTAPWVEEFLLPFDQSTIEDPGTGGGPGAEIDGDSDPRFEEETDDELVGPDGEPLDEHDIPYDTGG